MLGTTLPSPDISYWTCLLKLLIFFFFSDSVSRLLNIGGQWLALDTAVNSKITLFLFSAVIKMCILFSTLYLLVFCNDSKCVLSLCNFERRGLLY